MTETTTLDTMRTLEFLQGVSDEHLERLAAITRLAEYPAQSEMFRESDAAKEVFVIIEGAVSLVICEPGVGCRQLMEVRDGELVGWSPLVGRHRLSDSAYTLSPTTALAMDGERFLDLCREIPEFGFQMMQRVAHVLAQRLSATRLKLLEMSGIHLPDVQIESD